jgi:hypothetical protein
MDLSRIVLSGSTTSKAAPRPHLHQPERGEQESFADYRKRRAASNKANRDSRRDPNHGSIGSRQQFRNSLRQSGAMGKRTRAADALTAAWASKRITKAPLRDAHGAYTLTGPEYEVERMEPDTGREHVICSWVDGEDFGYMARRKWLGGISAQRGF